MTPFQTVSNLVARYFKIPQERIANLPYCQRRARIVGDTMYYGEQPDAELVSVIRKAVGNENLAVVHDDHEKRLREDVVAFRKIVRRSVV